MCNVREREPATNVCGTALICKCSKKATTVPNKAVSKEDLTSHLGASIHGDMGEGDRPFGGLCGPGLCKLRRAAGLWVRGASTGVKV